MVSNRLLFDDALRALHAHCRLTDHIPDNLEIPEISFAIVTHVTPDYWFLSALSSSQRGCVDQQRQHLIAIQGRLEFNQAFALNFLENAALDENPYKFSLLCDYDKLIDFPENTTRYWELMILRPHQLRSFVVKSQKCRTISAYSVR